MNKYGKLTGQHELHGTVFPQSECTDDLRVITRVCFDHHNPRAPALALTNEMMALRLPINCLPLWLISCSMHLLWTANTNEDCSARRNSEIMCPADTATVYRCPL